MVLFKSTDLHNYQEKVIFQIISGKYYLARIQIDLESEQYTDMKQLVNRI